MTKKLYFLILIFFIPFCQLFASHAVGADLTYDCLGGNTYRFRLKFYRDCAGIAAPTSVSINIASTSCSRSTSITMPLISSQEVSPLCAAQLPNSTCNGGSLPGIQQYIYEATYTLPANCPDWRFSYTLCCRNVAVTNSNNASSYNLYVEAMLNNQVVTCNSSPDFTVNPVPYICNGQPFSYNHGVVDVDGDSLSYTLIQPKHTATSNVPYSGSFTSTYPISTSPPNNFVFNPSTGQMTFTPGSTQIGLVAIRVDEFRNGVKIGSTIRDMQVIVINCGTNSTPAMGVPTTITGATYNTATSTFKACPNTPMSFQIVSTDLDAIQILTLTSNVLTSIPGATVSSTGTNPVTTTFTWTPTPANAGFYSISFRAVDNACPLTASVTRGFNIYVPSLRGSISDTMVCTGTGKAFNLNATPTGTDGTETYAWTPNVGFTTSSTIRNPSVNISTPQNYVVSMTQGGCVLTDTVKVKPYASLVASPDSSLCPFDPAIQLTSAFTKLMPTLSASPITYSWTPTAGLTPSATISNPSAKPVSTTSYILTAGDALCTMRDTVRISVVPCPCYDTARIASPKVLTCTQLLDTLDGSASTTGSSFQWIAYAGGNIVSGATTSTPIINQPGRYTLVITNLINGCKDSTFVIVTRNTTAPNINAGIDTVLNCVRTSLNLNATSSTTGATFAWSNGATTATTNVNAPNTYTVTATNPTNGCTASDAVVVTQNITTPNINAGIDTVLNCVRTSLNLNATSSTTGVTYAWSNGATTATTSVSTPNTYTVTVTNTYNRCTASDAVVVTQNITTPNINAGIDTVLNCVRTSLNLNATSSTTGVTYAWSNGATTATTSVSTPNTYTVTVTNTYNRCTASDAVVVTQNITTPNINAGIDTVLNCVRTSLNLNATSSTTGVTYAWSNGATTATTSVITPNTYTVTVTNTYNRCTASDAVVVTQNITTPNINAGIDTVLNCVRTSLNLNATSSTTGVTYAWSNGATTATTSVSTPNTYTVTVTNTYNRCTASDAVVVTQNITTPNINAGIDTVLNCVRTSLNLNATSSTTGVTYAWSNGATTATTSVSTPNTYTVTVTNTYNRCTASDAVVVTQNITTPNINAGIDTVLNCVRTSLNLNATSSTTGVTYAWSNGATTAPTSVSAPNTYTVTTTNPTNGCTASDAVVVTQNITTPNINAGIDTVLNCVRTSLNLNATSSTTGVTYAWSNGATTATTSVSTPNTYTVTVTNPTNGCTASDAVVVTQNLTAPVANAGVDTILYCNRTTISWSATSNVAGATYAWSNGSTTAANTTTVPNTYTVTVTNPLNGCTASDAMVISQNITAPIANAGVDTILYCNRTTINWSATSNVAGATYAWSNGSTTAANTTTVPNTYTVTVTNPLNGCTASDAMVISQNITAPVANAGVDTVLYCNRTTISWSATSNVAGATYAWSNGSTTAANTTTVPNTYTVTVTNPLNGCTASDAMVISQNITAPVANAGVDTVLYCNRTTINWSATSNVAGATYAWSNGSTTAANTTTVPNTYTVTVTNPLNGCTASDAMVISQNITAPIANAGVDTILYCNRTTISWSATSNVAGATYAWSNGSTTAANTTTVPNTYTVTVTNPLNGCTASDAMVISQNITAPIANAGVDTILYCNRTTINWSATSNVAGATYAWSNGSTTAANTTTVPNTYTVTVTNPLNGCTASDAMVISQNITAPVANAGVDTVLYCNRTTINWSATSNVAGATYAWSNGSTTAANTTTVPNTYTVTVTNPLNGCTASDAMVISQNITAPVANAGVDTVLYCNRTTINWSATSNVAGATYAWSNGSTTAANTTTVPNTYTVTVTNPLNGCTASDAMVIAQDLSIPNVNAGIDTVLNCVRTSLNLNATSSTTGVTFAWSNGAATSVANVSLPNTYTVTATDPLNGCTASDAVVVTQNLTAPIANAGVDTILYCNRTTINWTATSNVAGATYAWSNGSTTAANTTTVPNTYTVTVTNPYNGCTASDAMVVNQDLTTPGVNAGIDTVVNCVRTSLDLSASSSTAGATFAWSNGANTAVTNVSVPTTYTVTATHPINGCTSTDAVVVGIDTVSPNANAGVDTVINCTNPTISLLGSSSTYGVTVAWTGPGIVSGANTYSPVVNDAGLYTMTITNVVSGCVTTDDVNVSANFIVPNAEAGNLDSVTCADVQINLQGSSITSNVSYSWSGPGIVSGANTSSPLVNTAGLYTLTVTSLTNGCSKTDTVRVMQEITTPQVSAGADTTLTCVRTNLNLTATSSTPSPIGFAWSNGANTAVTNVNTNNTYTVTATNLINGCTVSDAVVVSMDTVSPGVNAGIDTVVNCVRTSLDLSASSSTAGATFAWSNGANTAVTNVSVPTTYTVTATHPINGCTSTDAVVVGIDTVSPNANAGVDTVINCTNPTISLLGSSSTYGVTVAWTGPGIVSGANTYSPVVNDAGLYTMTITNVVSGCVTTDDVNVSANFIVPNAEAGNLDSVTCADVQINLQGSSITPNVSYSWSGPGIVSGANTSSPLVNTAGLYTLTVTSLTNGCSKTDTVRVMQEITTPQVSAGADTTLTCVRTNLNLTATSSTPSPIGFAWSNGANTAVTNVNTNNTYTVTATNLINGCTVSDAVVVSMDTVSPGVNAGIDTVVNCVRTSLDLSASSSTAGATFAWSNGANTAVTNVSVPTTYTVTATHPINGCTSTDAVVVGIDTVSPNANAGVDTVINCTNPTISLLGSSSTYGVTVSWTGPGIVSGANTYSPVVNDAGLYTMTITNVVSGCVTTDGVNVSANFIVPNAEAGNLDSVTCADVQINLQGSSITSNVSYSWSGPGIVSGANTSSPLVNTAGLYTLTVTSLTNGCSKTDTVRVVQEITVPQVSAGADTTLTCVRTNLNLTATSSTPSPIGFAWSNGATTAVTNVNTNNTYTVTATNLINGCTVSDAVVVSMDTVAPGVNAGIDTVVNCVRTSLNLSASSPTSGATFAWSNGATTAITNVSAPTTYTVTATHPVNGCTSTDAVVVGIDTVSPNANAGVDTVINCTHPTISLLGSSSTYGVTVSWTGPGIVSGANTYSPVINDAGLYTMTITNVVSGCVTTDGVNVSANFIVPNAEAGNLDSVTCADVQINLQGSSITSNVSYSWSGPGIVSGANTSSPLVNTAGLYTLTVTSLTNGCSKTDTVRVVQEITVPQVSAGADTTLTCVRTNLNLTATSSTPSPIGFAWSNGATTAVTNVNTNNTYTVTATNLINGCTVSDAVVVSMDTVAPVLNAGLDTILNCVRRNLNLQASSNIAGATYQWSNGVSGIINPITTPNIYRVTATHPTNGCISTDAVIVVIDTTTPNINAGLDTTLKCYRRSVVLNATSTVPNMNYVWSNGTVGASNTVSAANMYTVIGQNPVNGCVNRDAVIVNVDTVAPNANAGPDKIVNCIKTSETLNASSTTPNVTFLWSNGTATAANTVSTTIAYTVTVTNPINGCTASDVAVLTPDTAAPGANAGADKDLTCTITSVSFTATSPTPNVSFQWSNGTTGQNITVSIPNTYAVTVTSLGNGCTSTDAVNANLVPPPTITYDVLDNPCPQVAKGHIVPMISGGKAPFTYTWNNGSHASALSGLHGGGYAVTITDANGCVITDTFKLVEKQFILDVTADQTEIELGEEVHFNSNITGGTGMESLTWNPGIFLSCDTCKNPTAGPMKSVKYNIVAVDTNGCSSTDTISIQVTPKYDLFVPNAFSPNNDGSNDVYEIFGNKKIWAEVEFKIFNRWGELIFESRDHEFKWDGTFKGELLTPQVVVYEFKVVYVDGYSAPTQKGSITIIR